MTFPNWAEDSSNTEMGESDSGFGKNAQQQSVHFDCDDSFGLGGEEEYQYNDESRTAGGGRSRCRRLSFAGFCVLVFVAAIVGISLGIPAMKNNGSRTSSSSSGQNVDIANIPPAEVPGAPTLSPGPTTSDAYLIGDIIDRVARFGGVEFDNPMSYQSRAKKWVMSQDFPVLDGSSLTTEQQAIQLYALACIYFNTFGVRSAWTDFQYGPDVALPGWFSSRGWLGTATDVCTWHGITCDDQGRVFKIQLDTNGLTGYLPPETAYLHESLNTIDLYNNLLHNKGDEGNSFLGELTNLEYLYFGSTSFEYDGVPPQIGKLTKLKELDFSYTLYFGRLDGSTFENLSNLKYLTMDGNAYNSSLPTQLVNLPELEYLYAGFSFLEGDLSFIPQMPKIFELWIDDNPGLSGSIPTTIGQASTLVSLSMTNCNLSGQLPTQLGLLTDLIQMWLYDNSFTGAIPTELGQLVKLKILNLQKNELTGDMPAVICDRRRPFGRLEELEADCDGAIYCDGDCCTCCGIECIDLGRRLERKRLL
ncbi:two component regulator [Nitzschia inconspicua]|uniref:Two component regulator n=1 Tax=Nitzschia inconspicua TaxID=303405 RepID=A0A9K3PZG3_9STRA|nr:two component regulator [Nitzschia inconspicua]